MCGVAYGWEDLAWAEKTLNFSKANIETLEQLDTKTLDLFIEYWKNKLTEKIL